MPNSLNSRRSAPEEDMEEVRGKYISPAIDQLAFNSPHCNALAKQFWFSVHADPLKSDEKPVVATAETVKTLTFGDIEEAERDRKLKWAEQMASGLPFLEVHREFRSRDVQNVSISYCFNCNERGGPALRDSSAAWLRWILGSITPPISPRLPA
jgi:hypothetical protein